MVGLHFYIYLFIYLFIISKTRLTSYVVGVYVKNIINLFFTNQLCRQLSACVVGLAYLSSAVPCNACVSKQPCFFLKTKQQQKTAEKVNLCRYALVSTAPPPPTENSGDNDFPSITALLNTPHCRDNWKVKVQLFFPICRGQ